MGTLKYHDCFKIGRVAYTVCEGACYENGKWDHLDPYEPVYDNEPEAVKKCFDMRLSDLNYNVPSDWAIFVVERREVIRVRTARPKKGDIKKKDCEGSFSSGPHFQAQFNEDEFCVVSFEYKNWTQLIGPAGFYGSYRKLEKAEERYLSLNPIDENWMVGSKIGSTKFGIIHSKIIFQREARI